MPWGNNLNTSPRQQQAEPPLPPPLSSLHHQTSPTPASAHLSLQAASPRLPVPRGCPVGSPGMAFLLQSSPFFQQQPRHPLAPKLLAPAPCSPLPCGPSTHTPIRSPQPGKGQTGNNSVSRRKSRDLRQDLQDLQPQAEGCSLPPAGTAGPTGAPVHPTVCSYTFRVSWSCLKEQLTGFFSAFCAPGW